MKKYKELIPILTSAAVIYAMVGAAEFTGRQEIIFPEASAIAIGALAAPSNLWNTNRIRLFATIMTAAAAGMTIVRTVPLPTAFQIPIGIAAAMTLIMLSRTRFLPAVSACVLPIMLGTRDPIYLLAVAAVTGTVLLAQFVFEKTGLREPQNYVPEKPDAAMIRLRILQTIAAGLVCMAAVTIGRPMMTAPPLIVAFAEMSSPASKAGKQPSSTVFMMILSALFGCSARLLFSELLGLPVALSAALTCLAVLFMLKRSEFFFPPCGAVAVLPFLISSDSMLRFPIDITLGFTALVLIKVVFSKLTVKFTKAAENTL